jgi:hypothetical protein
MYSDKIAEIKRMYVMQNSEEGIATQILVVLQQWAKSIISRVAYSKQEKNTLKR